MKTVMFILFILAPVVSGEDWELSRDAFINDRPPVEGDTVSITIGKAPAQFPRYFNELGVRRIRILFADPGGETKKLSFVWSGGSEGMDRFSVKVDGIRVGTSRLVDSARRPHAWTRDEFLVRLAKRPEHEIEIASIPEFNSALQFSGIRLGPRDAPDYKLLCYDSIGFLEQYEKSLGSKGVMVESGNLAVFAPYKDRKKARDLAVFLEKAYEEMVKIYGMEPLFKFSIENYPEGNERGWGGISGAGTIGYKIESLDRFAQMKQNDVRSFAGYTEEMSHGFKDYYRCGGTYEALGVAVQEDVVRGLVSKRIADAFWTWRHDQCEETYEAYMKAGRKNPDPEKYPWNVIFTRILNHLFLKLRQEYGPDLWPDFFEVIRQMDYPLHRAEKTERMKVYATIFSVLFGRDMQKEFQAFGIDLDADPPWGWETYS